MPSFLVQTLGCKLNQLESEAITDAFVKEGFEKGKVKSEERKETPNKAQQSCVDDKCSTAWRTMKVNEMNEGARDLSRAACLEKKGAINNKREPSIIIVNTCTVTSKADQKARRVIRKALRDYPVSCVLVTGCYARLNKEELSKLDGGEQRLFILSGSEKVNILDLPRYLSNKNNIHEALKYIFALPNSLLTDNSSLFPLPFSLFPGNTAFQFNPEKFSAHTRGFLKIQDGCDKHCTYCRIRLARGPSVSLDADELLTRLKILEKNHSEAVLTGVNISQYSLKESGKAQNANLASLLEHLLSGTEKIAIRLSSLAPESIDCDLAKILSKKRIRPHFHLSIQSGSKKILEKMGRGYDAVIIENAVSLLRRAKDDPFLACDIIAGFPSETEVEFNETLSMCKKIDFAWIHVFPYSGRSGTSALSFGETVRENEKQRRVQILTRLAQQGRADYIRRWLGREAEVLVEKSGSSAFCRGITENYLKTQIRPKNREKPPPGTVLCCKLEEKESQNQTYDAVAVEK